MTKLKVEGTDMKFIPSPAPVQDLVLVFVVVQDLVFVLVQVLDPPHAAPHVSRRGNGYVIFFSPDICYLNIHL